MAAKAASTAEAAVADIVATAVEAALTAEAAVAVCSLMVEFLDMRAKEEQEAVLMAAQMAA